VLHNTVATICVLSAAAVVGKGGGGVALGHWSGGQRAVPGCRPIIGKRSAAHPAWCTLCNKPNRS